MKISFFLSAFVFFCLVSNAQVTETDQGNVDLQQSLNTLFQNVNTSQAPTGFLMNKAVLYANIYNYNGRTITDSTDVNINTFGWIYATLYGSKVGSQSLPHPSV